MHYNIEYLPLADDDLYDIADYFSQFYPSTLKIFMNTLEEHISNLQDMPYIGVEYKNYRRLVVSDFLVFYKVLEDKKLVRIYRIIHGARDSEIQNI